MIRVFDDTIDLNSTDSVTALVSRDRHGYLAVQAVAESAAWSAAVVTVEVSLDGNSYFGIPAGAVTLSDNGITPIVDVRAYPHVRARVTTPNGSDCTGRIHFAFTDRGV